MSWRPHPGNKIVGALMKRQPRLDSCAHLIEAFLRHHASLKAATIRFVQTRTDIEWTIIFINIIFSSTFILLVLLLTVLTREARHFALLLLTWLLWTGLSVILLIVRILVGSYHFLRIILDLISFIMVKLLCTSFFALQASQIYKLEVARRRVQRTILWITRERNYFSTWKRLPHLRNGQLRCWKPCFVCRYAAASEFEELTGIKDWCKDPSSGHYEWQALQDHCKKLKSARAQGNSNALLFLLRISANRDFCGLSSQALFARTYTRTKDCIHDFMDEYCSCLNWLRDDFLQRWEKLSKEDRLHFTRQNPQCGYVYGNYYHKKPSPFQSSLLDNLAVKPPMIGADKVDVATQTDWSSNEDPVPEPPQKQLSGLSHRLNAFFLGDVDRRIKNICRGIHSRPTWPSPLNVETAPSTLFQDSLMTQLHRDRPLKPHMNGCNSISSSQTLSTRMFSNISSQCKTSTLLDLNSADPPDAQSTQTSLNHSLTQPSPESSNDQQESECFDHLAQSNRSMDRITTGEDDGLYDLSDLEMTGQIFQLFSSLRLSFGRTALCLSGGGSLAMYHIGVVRCLLKRKCLPRVISGTSGGSIVAGILAIYDDEALLNEILMPDIVTRYGRRWFPPMIRQINQFILKGDFAIWSTRNVSSGQMLDEAEFKKTCQAYYQDYTFREAFDRTGRMISVVVTPANRSLAEAMILNYINSPDVYLWSSVVASCALPGLLPAQQLMAKSPHGKSVPFSPLGQTITPVWTKEVSWLSGLKWIDGSISLDIPIRELASLFNVKQVIVSQVNPHHAPFVKSFNRKFRALRTVENYLTLDMKHRYAKLTELNMVPTILGQDISTFWMLQEFEGNVTITPRASLVDYYRMINQPTIDDMEDFIAQGDARTWPHCAKIDHIIQIERCLREAWKYLWKHVHEDHG